MKCWDCGRSHDFQCGRCWTPLLKGANKWIACHTNPLLKDTKFCWGYDFMPHDPEAKTLAKDPMGVEWAT